MEFLPRISHSIQFTTKLMATSVSLQNIKIPNWQKKTINIKYGHRKKGKIND